ncbi:ATP-binding protein [Clostridium senegalense]
MNKTFHSQVMKMYETVRKNEELKLEKRKMEIQKALPQVIDIENEIGKLSVKLSLIAIKPMDNKDAAINSIKNKMIDLKMKKSELLVSNGYPMDYLSLIYKCDKCKDTGYIYTKKCDCYKRYLVKVGYENSDLKHLLDKHSFKNFDINYFSKDFYQGNLSPRANMERIYKSSIIYVEDFKNHNENLLFYGNPGTGKTFLSHCIAKDLIDAGHFVIYRTSDDLISNLKDAKFNNNIGLYESLVDCDLLIIDDLGTEQLSDFSKKELFNLLNTKLLKDKKMIISTNYALDELSSIYSERFTSRLFGNFTLKKFFGDDLRLKVARSKRR